MPAAPFGRHPTFGQYLQWAMELGCTVNQGYISDERGRPISITRIESPSGRWVIEAGTHYNDYLVPTTIARLDRRPGPEIALVLVARGTRQRRLIELAQFACSSQAVQRPGVRIAV